MRWRRIVALAGTGALLSFVGFTSYIVLAGIPLKAIGVPPANWFGSDYTDPRGALVSGTLELFVMGLATFAVARVLQRRFRFASRLDAFWLCNPMSTAVGILVGRHLVLNAFPFELTAPAGFLLLISWLVAWWVAVLGFREATWVRAISVVAACSVAVFGVGMVRVYQVYGFE
jgi:hypothetical protein